MFMKIFCKFSFFRFSQQVFNFSIFFSLKSSADRKQEQVGLFKMILEDIETKTNEILPEMIRLPPPIVPIREQEFVFPYPSILDSLELEWDNNILEKDENKEVKELRNTLKKSFTTHFYPNQTQQILARLRSYEQLIFEIDINPEKFMELVE